MSEMVINKNDELQRFVSLIDRYFAAGGSQLQFNVVSKKRCWKHSRTQRNMLIFWLE